MCSKPAPLRGQTTYFSFGSLLQMPVRLTVIAQDSTCTLFRASDPRSEVTCHAQVCRQKTAKSQKERLANMHAMRSVPASPHHNNPNAETKHWISRLQLQLKIAQFFSPLRRCCSAHNCCPLPWRLCFPSLSKFKCVE